MAKVLSISSQVVYGHVGNSSTAFVLQRMGHEVLSLPTILLSNRPGYEAIAGEPIDPGKLDALLAAALRNGSFRDIKAILSGYIPTPGHAALCERWIKSIKALNAEAIYLCDPIIGDEPGGVYISQEAAAAVRDLLVPLADIITPNCFEAGWLSGRQITDPASAATAAQHLLPPTVLITSAPASSRDHLANILVEGQHAAATVCPRETVHAHGTGDFFAANFLGHLLKGFDKRLALQAASSAISLVLAASVGQAELNLIGTQASWAAGDPELAPFASFPGLTAPL
jgi:pyridoxine kinase